jgi:hypothetical protein
MPWLRVRSVEEPGRWFTVISFFRSLSENGTILAHYACER